MDQPENVHQNHVNQPVPVQSMNTQQYLYQRPRRNWTPWIAVLLILAVPFCCCGTIVASLFEDSSSFITASAEYTYFEGDQNSENKLLSIPVNGPIYTDGNPNDPFAGLLYEQAVFGYAIKDTLIKATADTTIKGVILEISSPGGTIVGSKAISDGVAYYKKQTGNPVYAYVQEMAASGGYWAAASTDRILMEQGAMAGSIGVIFGPFEYYDQLVSLGSVGTAGGIDMSYITAGTYKDLGNPLRKLSTEEKDILQNQVNNEYDVFVNHVSLQRKIQPATIREKVKALIYGAKDAVALGLVDEIATRGETYDKVATAANIADYQVVRETYNSSFISAFFGSLLQKKTATVSKSCSLCGQMLYLYGSPLEYKVTLE